MSFCVQYTSYLQVGKHGSTFSRAPHKSVAKQRDQALVLASTSTLCSPLLPLSPLGLFCSPDQSKLCLGIVFPKKFPL